MNIVLRKVASERDCFELFSITNIILIRQYKMKKSSKYFPFRYHTKVNSPKMIVNDYQRIFN